MTRLAENAWDCLEDGLVLLPRLYPYLVQHATAEAKREWFSRPLNAEECLMFTWQPVSVFEKGIIEGSSISLAHLVIIDERVRA